MAHTPVSATQALEQLDGEREIALSEELNTQFLLHGLSLGSIQGELFRARLQRLRSELRLLDDLGLLFFWQWLRNWFFFLFLLMRSKTRFRLHQPHIQEVVSLPFACFL